MENPASLHGDRLSLFVGVKCFQNFGPHGTELLLQKLKKNSKNICWSKHSYMLQFVIIRLWKSPTDLQNNSQHICMSG